MRSEGLQRGLLGRDAHILPGVPHGGRLPASLALEALRRRDAQPSESGEARVAAQGRVAQRLVPDASGHLPRVAADLRGREVEGVVRYARVDVHAAVVADRLDVVVHV